MHFKRLSVKWQPFHLGFSVLTKYDKQVFVLHEEKFNYQICVEK